MLVVLLLFCFGWEDRLGDDWDIKSYSEENM